MQAYPLSWPLAYKRRSPDERISSLFKKTMEKAQQFLHSEIGRLQATDLIVSTNIPVRKDGLLFADWMNRKIDDPGVAIYFKYEGKDVSMCCDQYEKVWENIYALGKSIEALRGIDRWGVSDFISRSFTGFKELPPAAPQLPVIDIWQVLGLDSPPNLEGIIHAAYKAKAKKIHPDVPGGSAVLFQELQSAYDKALTFFKQNAWK